MNRPQTRQVVRIQPGRFSAGASMWFSSLLWGWQLCVSSSINSGLWSRANATASLGTSPLATINRIRPGDGQTTETPILDSSAIASAAVKVPPPIRSHATLPFANPSRVNLTLQTHQTHHQHLATYLRLNPMEPKQTHLTHLTHRLQFAPASDRRHHAPSRPQ